MRFVNFALLTRFCGGRISPLSRGALKLIRVTFTRSKCGRCRDPSTPPGHSLRSWPGSAQDDTGLEVGLVPYSRLLVPPDFLSAVAAVAGRRGKPRLYTGVGRGGRGCRRGWGWFGLGTYFVSSEVAAFGGSHLRHGSVGLRVVVIGVPEEKADAAFLFRNLNLNFNIFRRVSLGAPGKRLQPGANHDATVLGDEHEAVHGLTDEMLGRVAGVRDAVHANEMRGIDHGREHVTVLGHGYNVLPGMRKIDGTLP